MRMHQVYCTPDLAAAGIAKWGTLAAALHVTAIFAGLRVPIEHRRCRLEFDLIAGLEKH